MATKNILNIVVVLALAFLLVGCTSETITPQNTNANTNTIDKTTNSDNVEPVEIVTEAPEVKQGDYTIIISDGKLDPSELTVAVNEEVSILIYNKNDDQVRIDMPFYSSGVSADINPEESELVFFTSGYKGSTPIELNGIPVGTIITE